MSERGVVYDLGYMPHEGPRLGRLGAIASTLKDGVRRVLGLRRRARSKILPWLLFGTALLPAAFFVGFAFFQETFAPDSDSFFGHSVYFAFIAPVMMIFTIFAAPELLIPDRKEGVLAVYSSRPISPADYLLSRSAALGIVVGGFLLLPQLLVYFGFAAIDDSGFLAALLENWTDLWKILLTSVAFFFGYAPLAFLVSVYASRRATASGTLFALLFGSLIVLQILAENASLQDVRYAALLAFLQHPFVMRDWIWDQAGPGTTPAEAGFDPIVSLAVIVVVTIVSAVVALRHYRRLM